MTVSLLRLSNGHLSLEFGNEDVPSVGAFIRDNWPDVEKTQYPTHAVYRFGSCSFAFQNEWDDPCLISGSSDGDRLLEQILAGVETRSAVSSAEAEDPGFGAGSLRGP